MTDFLSPEQRSKLMSRVRRKDTNIEKIVRSELHKRGFRFRKHVKYLPGTPDLVFTRIKIAVFLDGDFWHGYRLPKWEHKLQYFWKDKIRKNRERDQKNFRKLRRMDWKVIRIWQHEIEKDLDSCVERIISAINERV